MNSGGPHGPASSGSLRTGLHEHPLVGVPFRYGPFRGMLCLSPMLADAFRLESTFAATSGPSEAPSADWQVVWEQDDRGDEPLSRCLDRRIAAVGAARVLQAGGFVLHASAVRLGSNAFVFTAHSGTGKSTTARRLCPPALVVADDQCVLLPEGVADEAPWRSEPPRHPGRRAHRWTCSDVRPANAPPTPLAVVHLLERGKATGVRPVAPKEAFRRLLSHLVLEPSDPALHRLAIEAVVNLLEDVPVHIASVSLEDLCVASLGLKDG